MPPVPEFPEFAPLDLHHRDEINAVLGSMERPISELSFANLYLFRQPHGYRVSRLGGLLLITATTYEGKPYAFPPWGEGDVTGAAKELCAVLAARNAEPVIFPVPENLYKRYFEKGEWTGEPDRDSADYVYLRENLALLPGSRYHKKKNRLNKYAREAGGELSFAPLDDANVKACIELALGWCEDRCSIDRPSTYAETKAAVEALDLRRELGLSGGTLSLDGRLVAYCLGEPLDPETFVVHFEKAVPGMDGPAQTINRDFCLNSLGGFRYVNREQDLGDPGLRQAKESYYPEFLALKYRVKPV